MEILRKLTLAMFLVVLAGGVILINSDVLAHVLNTGTAATDDAHNSDEDTAGDDGAGNHALIRSVVVSSDYLTTAAPITATITFANAVPAVPDDPDTTGAGNNEAKHATLAHSATDPLTEASFAFEYGTKVTDTESDDFGKYTWAAATAGPRITGVIKTTPQGTGENASGAVYTVYIQVPTDLAAGIDGMYRITIASGVTDIFHPEGDANSAYHDPFHMDTVIPTVTNVAERAIGQNYANLDGEWSNPFEITFTLADPSDVAADDTMHPNSASGLELTSLEFDVKDDMNKNDVADELTFGSPRFIGQNQYVVTATPVTSRTATKAAVELRVTVRVMDKAGNTGRSTDDLDGATGNDHEARDPLTVKLAQRAATGTVGPGPGDTTPPTVTSITSKAGTNADTGKVIFTITFSEALTTTGENAFTVADLKVSNSPALTAADLTTTDNTVYMLKITPTNDDFPVKVSFVSGAKVGDTSNNLLGSGQTGLAATGTYTPPGVLGVEIDAPENLALGVLVFTFTFAEAPSEREGDPGQFTVSDIRVENAQPLVAANLTKQLKSDDGVDEVVFELDVTPIDATKSVTVQLKARSVSNGEGDNPATDAIETGTPLIAGEISSTWTPTTITPEVPPDTIMIPANSFVVVVRDKDAAGADGLAFRSEVMVREWPEMPNLERLFYRGSDGVILGRGGGGALILKQSGTPAVNPGTVGISEIMWGINASYFGEDREDASQWVELHNLNSAAVNVTLSYKTGRDITSDTSLTGNLGAPTLDVVTNFFNNRPGSPSWQVPGANGASATGINFVSMARILPHNKAAYANADGARYTNRDGRHSGHWTASTAAYLRLRTTRTDVTDVIYEYIGTPGRVNSFRADVQPDIRASRTGISHAITINEVGNNANNNYDWLELKGTPGTNLRNYMISIVTSNNSDVPLVQFDANDNAKIADNGVFLLLRTDPANDPNHPIPATGYNVDKSAQEQQPGQPSSPVRYKVFSGGARGMLNLPNDGKFVLILRSPDNGEGQRSGQDGVKGVAETGNNDLNRVVDVAGWDDDLARGTYPNAVSSTGVWPLHQFRDIKPFTNNSFAQNTVHQRNRVGTNDGASGVGAQDNNNGKTAFGDRGWTGVGYRRKVANTAMHGGTPGYPNGASHGAGTAITGAVYISEIMYANGARNSSLPQWIEIRNTSKTMGADLHNWRLTIKNHADKEMHEDGDWEGKFESSVLLRNLKIKPNSAVLITSRKGPRQDVHLADNEIFSLWPAHRTDFGMANANTDVINTFGFRITLHANGHDGNRNNWQLVDDVGNLATPDATARSGNNERFDMPRWMWPDANDERNNRTSVARKVKDKATGEPTNGSKKWSWLLTSMDSRFHQIDNTYYGHANDISTPGQTLMSPLPVSLSFFRPTLEDGKVVVRWTTESELDNAGFNIYRSETSTGEFKQVNEALIDGKGTTAERSTYKWIDPSAKPGVVYYYQIEDVSFAGERTTLTTTKLKGLISAKGKLTTTWSELKEVQ